MTDDTKERDDERKKIGRVYGRGFADGMNKRQQSLIDGLNGVSRKVFDTVPIGEAWNAANIGQEIVRRYGTVMNRPIMDGALLALVAQGLIRETEHGLFYRDPERQVIVKKDQIMQPPAPTAPTAPTNDTTAMAMAAESSDPLERLAVIAKRIRDLAAAYNALADDLEVIALDAAKAIQAAQHDSERARQLRALLKEFA